MRKLLQRLDAALRRQRAAYYATFNPWATNDQLRALEVSLRMLIPSELRDLLEWKNGHPQKLLENGYADMGEPFYDRYRLMSAEQIGNTVEELRRASEDEGWGIPGWWNPRYIPFGHDFYGNYLVIDMSGPLLKRGRIIDWTFSSRQRVVLCGSLSGLLECVVAGLESGLVDPEQDAVRFREILIQQNPGYPFYVEPSL